MQNESVYIWTDAHAEMKTKEEFWKRQRASWSLTKPALVLISKWKRNMSNILKI